jgi:hypothetical protein
LLSYTPDELRQLDKATVKWLGQIGVLAQVSMPDAQVITDIEKLIRNGVLLCSLVETLFTKQKLSGVFKDPKTEATSQQNIRKALEVLRKERRMDQAFTWSDK